MNTVGESGFPLKRGHKNKINSDFWKNDHKKLCFGRAFCAFFGGDGPSVVLVCGERVDVPLCGNRGTQDSTSRRVEIFKKAVFFCAAALLFADFCNCEKSILHQVATRACVGLRKEKKKKFMEKYRHFCKKSV